MRRAGALLVLVLTASSGRSAVSRGAGPAAPPAVPYAASQPLPQPRRFGEGVLSTEDDELGGTFSPDGRDFYFAKRTPATIVSSVVVICVSHFENGKWGRPRVAPFSGQFFDFSPSFSPDGRKLFFSSVRAIGGENRKDSDIWYVEKKPDGGWSEPRNLGAPIDVAGPDQNASVASDGTIYFASIRGDGKNGFDIYKSRLVDGKYAEPENLGDAVNSEAAETQPYVSPDQSFLIFSSLGRTDAPIAAGSPYPRSDLYVSVQENGKWTPARHLPPSINTDATESYPFVSPDGRYLFFTSERNFTSIPMRTPLPYGEMQRLLHGPGNGLGDLYQVDVDAIGIEGIGRRPR